MTDHEKSEHIAIVINILLSENGTKIPLLRSVFMQIVYGLRLERMESTRLISSNRLRPDSGTLSNTIRIPCSLFDFSAMPCLQIPMHHLLRNGLRKKTCASFRHPAVSMTIVLFNLSSCNTDDYHRYIIADMSVYSMLFAIDAQRIQYIIRSQSVTKWQ